MDTDNTCEDTGAISENIEVTEIYLDIIKTFAEVFESDKEFMERYERYSNCVYDYDINYQVNIAHSLSQLTIDNLNNKEYNKKKDSSREETTKEETTKEETTKEETTKEETTKEETTKEETTKEERNRLYKMLDAHQERLAQLRKLGAARCYCYGCEEGEECYNGPPVPEKYRCQCYRCKRNEPCCDLRDEAIEEDLQEHFDDDIFNG